MNYYIQAHDLYKIFGLDWEYCGQQKSEMYHLHWLEGKIGIEKLVELCYWIQQNHSEWNKFGLIRSNLAYIMARINPQYPPEFEIKIGYCYHDEVEKRKAYEKWKGGI